MKKLGIVLLIIGVLTMVGATIGGVYSLVSVVNVAEDSESLGTGQTADIDLEKGEYNLYIRSDQFGFGDLDESDVRVAHAGSGVTLEDPGDSTETYSIDDREYAVLAKFEAETDGIYEFNVNSADHPELYVGKSPVNSLVALGASFGVGVFGFFLAALGLILVLVGRSRQKRNQQPPYPPQYQQPPQQQWGQQQQPQQQQWGQQQPPQAPPQQWGQQQPPHQQ